MNKIHMPERRSNLEVLYAMVKLCIEEGGVMKTSMMYRTNQSFSVLNRNLNTLKKIGWLQETERNKRTVYVATDRGKRAVEGYKIIFNEIPEEYRHHVLGEITRRFLP